MRMALGRALLRTDRGSEAEAQFREAGTLNGGPATSLAVAEALLQQGKHAEAAEQFLLYLKDTPGGEFVIENAGLVDGPWREHMSDRKFQMTAGQIKDTIEPSQVKIFVKE